MMSWLRRFLSFGDRVAQAWEDGYNTASDEAQADIDEQAQIITDLIKVVDAALGWEKVHPNLRERLRDYV